MANNNAEGGNFVWRLGNLQVNAEGQLPEDIRSAVQQLLPSEHARLSNAANTSSQWTELEKLYVQQNRLEQFKHFDQQISNQKKSPTILTKDVILKRIEALVQEIVVSISKREAPVMYHSNRRQWTNITFSMNKGISLTSDHTQTAVRFDTIASTNKFALTVKVLSLLYELVQRDTFSTKRDLFYQAPQLFGSQASIDAIIDNISCMLSVPRWQLNVLASSKGCVAGDLRYHEHDENFVDCRQTTTGIVIPSHVTAMKNIRSSAKFVLIVEKDATFQSLLDDGVCEKLNPCIVITGKGFPDMNTRLLVRLLWDNFHLPILALVDADPHGMEIMCIYKFGSMSLSFEADNLTVPAVKWLGLLPTDIDRLGIPSTSLVPLTQADKEKARELIGRPYMESLPEWRREIDATLCRDSKAELQSLSAISPSYLLDVYLPTKLKYGGWI